VKPCEDCNGTGQRKLPLLAVKPGTWEHIPVFSKCQTCDGTGKQKQSPDD